MIRYSLIGSESHLSHPSASIEGAGLLTTTLSDSIIPISDTEANLKLSYSIHNNPEMATATIELLYRLHFSPGQTKVNEMECLVWTALNHIEDWYRYDGVCAEGAEGNLPAADTYALAAGIYTRSRAVCNL